MYILNIATAMKKMSFNEIRDFVFENFYKRIGFSKENRYHSKKSMQRMIYCCVPKN